MIMLGAATGFSLNGTVIIFAKAMRLSSSSLRDRDRRTHSDASCLHY